MFQLPAHIQATGPNNQRNGEKIWDGLNKEDPVILAERSSSKSWYKLTDIGSNALGDRIHAVQVCTLKGVQAVFLTYGATCVYLSETPSDWDNSSLVLNYDTLQGYLDDRYFIGSTVGRICNRVSPLDLYHETTKGTTRAYSGSDHDQNVVNHGGKYGWWCRVWRITNVTSCEEGDGVAVTMEYISNHGEQGFPGSVKCIAEMKLCDRERPIVPFTSSSPKSRYFSLEYSYASEALDCSTHVNICPHPYFNLARTKESVLPRHEMKSIANRVLDLDERSVPTGKISLVSPDLDFSSMRCLATNVPQAAERGGYDRFYLRPDHADCDTKQAVVHIESKDVDLHVHSNQPGFQFYSGNYLGSIPNDRFVQYQGFCIEPSLYLNALQTPEFPSTLLQCGKKRLQYTGYEFHCKR